jgi:predicted kinase
VLPDRPDEAASSRHHRRVTSPPRIIPIVEPSLVVLIGAAGSGKSTFAQRHFEGADILSSDALREVVSGDAADQAASGLAFRILYRMLVSRLQAGRSAVIDATNTRARDRKALLVHAARLDVPAVAIVLDLPPPLIHARAAARPERLVDPAIIDRQIARVRRTVEGGELLEEGYGQVVVLATADEVEAVVVVRDAVAPGSG